MTHIVFFLLLLVFVGTQASTTAWTAHTIIACTIVICSFAIYNKLHRIGKRLEELSEQINNMTDRSNDDLT